MALYDLKQETLDALVPGAIVVQYTGVADNPNEFFIIKPTERVQYERQLVNRFDPNRKTLPRVGERFGGYVVDVRTALRLEDVRGFIEGPKNRPVSKIAFTFPVERRGRGLGSLVVESRAAITFVGSRACQFPPPFLPELPTYGGLLCSAHEPSPLDFDDVERVFMSMMPLPGSKSVAYASAQPIPKDYSIEDAVRSMRTP